MSILQSVFEHFIIALVLESLGAQDFQLKSYISLIRCPNSDYGAMVIAYGTCLKEAACADYCTRNDVSFGLLTASVSKFGRISCSTSI